MRCETSYQIRLFGGTEVRTPGGTLSARDFGGIKPRHILQLLALRGALSKAELADLLWQGSPPADHVATLESYVSLLRRRLHPGAPARESIVVTRNGGYALDPERASTDVTEFDALVAAATHQPPATGLRTLTAALRLARQPLLVDEPYVTWAADARERYRSRLVDAATRAAEHALAIGDAELAQDCATRATTAEPLAEQAWRVRMSAYRQSGDRVAALRSYETCRRALAEDLGVAPTPATSDLFVGILSEDSGAAGFDDVVLAVLAAARDIASGDDRQPGGSGGSVVRLLSEAQDLIRQAPERGPRREFNRVA